MEPHGLLELCLNLPEFGLIIHTPGKPEATRCSVPVVDIERGEATIPFRIQRVPPTVEAALRGEGLEVTPDVHFDGAHRQKTYPAISPPPQGIPPYVTDLHIQRRQSDFAREIISDLVGAIVFTAVFKAPERHGDFTKDHTPVRLKLTARNRDGALLLLTNLSEGFLMRGKHIEGKSRGRAWAARVPAPLPTVELFKLLLRGLPMPKTPKAAGDSTPSGSVSTLTVLSAPSPMAEAAAASEPHVLVRARQAIEDLVEYMDHAEVADRQRAIPEVRHIFNILRMLQAPPVLGAVRDSPPVEEEEGGRHASFPNGSPPGLQRMFAPPQQQYAPSQAFPLPPASAYSPPMSVSRMFSRPRLPSAELPLPMLKPIAGAKRSRSTSCAEPASDGGAPAPPFSMGYRPSAGSADETYGMRHLDVFGTLSPPRDFPPQAMWHAQSGTMWVGAP